jgi:nucleotide-binding universal stress UspA family protein
MRPLAGAERAGAGTAVAPRLLARVGRAAAAREEVAVSLESKSEALRRAVRWISDARSGQADADVKKLVAEAGLRFDLTPLDQEFLWDTFVRQRPATPPAPPAQPAAAPAPPAETAARPYRKILCAIDFSEPSRVAMRRAVELAASSGASLTLLHVYLAPLAPAEMLPDPRWLKAVIDEAGAALTTWRAEAREGGAREVQVAMLEGVAWSCIVQVAREGGHDLVVVGTHGRTGIKHALLGSVAERVVRHAPCPVLVVR